MNGWSNEELARRLRGGAPPGSPEAPTAAQPVKPPVLRIDAGLAPPRNPNPHTSGQIGDSTKLSTRDIEALFHALRRGTRRHIGREPTLSELQALVDAVNRARSFAALVTGAVVGVLIVYPDADGWGFRSADEDEALAA